MIVAIATSVVVLAALGAAAWPWRVPLTKVMLRAALRLLYRVEVQGLEHAHAVMPRAVIAANHASFLDGLLLGAFLPGRPVFAVDTQIAKQWWRGPSSRSSTRCRWIPPTRFRSAR